MKKLISLLGILLFTFSFSQVKWMTLEEALEAQKTQPKKILIDFYADWCGPCKIMEKKTYNHPVISAYLNKNYYAVKFNTERKEPVKLYGKTFSNPNYKNNTRGKNSLHEFTKYMNVNAVPSIILLDEHTNPITILQGAMTAKELEPYLPFFATDEYQKIKTREQWENYQNKFKSKIKE